MGNRTEPEDLWHILLHARLQERMTAVQYRRVCLVYGLADGEPHTYRQAADVEGRHPDTIHESVQAALARVRVDACLLLLYLDAGL